MSKLILVGSDVIKINDRIITDLADGDAGVLAFAGNLVSVRTGKEGNNTYAFNEGGRQCTLALNVLRGSEDDIFLNTLLARMKSDFSSFVMLTGEIIKSKGDGLGNVQDEVYILSGGVFAKEVGVKVNTSGGTDQTISSWNFIFTSAPRTIGENKSSKKDDSHGKKGGNK